jgi:hypothetical protein
MKMTEQVAKTKWCPHAREWASSGANPNRHDNGEPRDGCKCLASGCALWRWGDNTGPEDISWREHHGAEKIEPTGFCGLSN